MRWGGAEDAEGIAFDVKLEKTPEFFEIAFEEELNLMLEVCGRWFYKAAGENDSSQGGDWAENYYCTMTKLPILRIRYEAVEQVQ